MKRIKHLALIVISLVVMAASGCASITEEDMARLGGAGFGALIGNQFGGEGKGNVLSTVLGGVAGGWLGEKLSEKMKGAKPDESDLLRIDQAAEHQINKKGYGTHYERWTNPSSGVTFATSVTTKRVPVGNTMNCAAKKIFLQVVDTYVKGKKTGASANREGFVCFDHKKGVWYYVDE